MSDMKEGEPPCRATSSEPECSRARLSQGEDCVRTRSVSEKG